MARKKLKLAYITDDSTRRQTFKHRKKGFMKKLNEIKTLCGVDACAVVYDQFNSNAEVWPSNEEATKVIERFEALGETDQTQRSVNHEEFLHQYIAKVEKKTEKMVEDNNEDCLKEIMFKCLRGQDIHMNDNVRRDLCKFIDQYLKALLHHKNVFLNNPHFEIGESSSLAPTNMATNLEPIPSLMAPSNMATNVAPNPFLMAPTNMDTNLAPFPSLMAPTTMDEASPFAILHASSFTFPQLTNELQCIASSNQEQALHIQSMDQVNSLATNLHPNNDQDVHMQSVDQSIPSYQGPEQFNYLASDFLPDNNQEVYIPVMDQNEFQYQEQEQNQDKGFVEEMMDYAEETGFPWMGDNNHNQF